MIRFSVIVPVYEQWHLVPKLLDRLVRQDLPQDRFEILLVDNGSASFRPPDTRPPNLQILECASPGSYAARNRGVAQSKGAWLCFTDADCLPDPAWLSAISEATMRHGEATLLAGAVEMCPVSAAPDIYETYDMVKGIPQAWYVRRGYAATANLAVAREVFDAVGGFDERRFSGGDADFCRRAVAEGYGLVFVPEAKVTHPARAAWSELRTKARRIKGGQLFHQPPGRRLKNLLRTFTPPVIAVARFASDRRHPLPARMKAIAVQLRVWSVEMGEALRLLTGQTRERK